MRPTKRHMGFLENPRLPTGKFSLSTTIISKLYICCTTPVLVPIDLWKIRTDDMRCICDGCRCNVWSRTDMGYMSACGNDVMKVHVSSAKLSYPLSRRLSQY
jgi:hypothetical protein